MIRTQLDIYSHDDNDVRYCLVKKSLRANAPDWIFFPGGPGVDSAYYKPLIKELDIHGNIWLLDLPDNGSNKISDISEDYDFENWGTCFIEAIERFNNPILVGHSFGGMFPLFFPKLEELLSGFIILNSAPRLWQTEALNYALENNIQYPTETLIAFQNDPNDDTLRQHLVACAHCYFPQQSYDKGLDLFRNMAINPKAILWWVQKSVQLNFSDIWVPQEVPTLIIGGKKDFITPYFLFEQDQRFQRSNVSFHALENAGHFPWIEEMHEVKKIFKSFENRLYSQ